MDIDSALADVLLACHYLQALLRVAPPVSRFRQESPW